MKRFVFSSFALLIALTSLAQRSSYIDGKKSIDPAKAYFRNNISYLDAIEGMYEVSMIPYYSGGNMLFGLNHWRGNESSSIAYIAKQQDGSYVCRIYNAENMSGVFKISSLGSSNIFRFIGEYGERYSHFGNSGYLYFDVSARFVFEGTFFNVEFSGNDGYHKVEMIMSFVKTYPDIATHNESVSSTNWSGTGFALKGGYIMTNYHVVEEANAINIYGIGGDFTTGIKATVVGSDKSNDLALLKISGSIPASFNSVPYGFKSKIADVGEDVYVLGYPLTATMGEEVKLTNGIVSARTGFDGDVSQYQISAPVQPGNSGGPLFDYNGNVIGVICAKHRGAENASYAVKTSQVRNLIESVSDLSIMNTTNTLQGKPLKDQVKSVNKYVYIIKCSK